MFPFRRANHEFRASPLCLAVPLDGSETVVGLRQLDLYHRRQHLHSRLDAGVHRVGYERYQGPYIQELTVDDLRKPRPLWDEFVYNGNWDAYNVPEHLGMLQERMEENVVYYMVNYLYLLCGVALMIISVRPLTLIGLLFLGLSAYINLFHLGNAAAAANGVDTAVQGPTARDSDTMAGLRTPLVVITWLVVARTGCLGSLLSWVFSSMALVGAHAALRIPRSEYRCKIRPGVPLKDVLGLERGPVRHPDPQRVFREAWQQFTLQAMIAYEFASAFAGDYWWRFRVAVYQRTGLRI